MIKRLFILFYAILTVLIPMNGQPYWNNIHFKEKLKDTLLVNDHFVYSDFCFKDENGKWQSTLWDEKGNQILDTTLYLIGSSCTVDNGDPHIARFCDCSLNSDTLSIVIFDNNPAYSDEITILAHRNKFTSSFKTSYQLYYPGEEYFWEIKNQKLKMSTDRIEKGRWLNGFINLDIIEFFRSNTYPLSFSKIKIKGFFKCIVK